MTEIPKSSDELADRIILSKNYPIEYVEDISLNNRFGLSIEGYINIDGEQHNVSGSIVLDDNGDPEMHKMTRFILRRNITEPQRDETVLLDGKNAVEAAKKIYRKHNNAELTFKTEEEASDDIRDIAKRPKDQW